MLDLLIMRPKEELIDEGKIFGMTVRDRYSLGSKNSNGWSIDCCFQLSYSNASANFIARLGRLFLLA